MMIQRLTKLALIGVLFMNMGSFSMQPNDNNANNEAPWRQAKRVAAFTLGALAMGANTYLAIRSNSSLTPDSKAGFIGLSALFGGMCASSYCNRDEWQNKQYKGSFTAAVSYAVAGAAFACTLHKISEGKGFSDILPFLAAWLVGNKVYYAQ